MVIDTEGDLIKAGFRVEEAFHIIGTGKTVIEKINILKFCPKKNKLVADCFGLFAFMTTAHLYGRDYPYITITTWDIVQFSLQYK